MHILLRCCCKELHFVMLEKVDCHTEQRNRPLLEDTLKDLGTTRCLRKATQKPGEKVTLYVKAMML